MLVSVSYTHLDVYKRQSPYQVMLNRAPPREITSLIEFPFMEEKESAIIEIQYIIECCTKLNYRREKKKEIITGF